MAFGGGYNDHGILQNYIIASQQLVQRWTYVKTTKEIAKSVGKRQIKAVSNTS